MSYFIIGVSAVQNLPPIHLNQEIDMKTHTLAIQEFCSIEGYPDGLTAVETLFTDPGTPNSICVNDDCTYTELVEDDCADGFCPDCKTQTLQSIMILMGII